MRENSCGHPMKPDVITELMELLEDCCESIEILAYYYDGSTTEDLEPVIPETSGHSKNALINVIRARRLINMIKTRPKTYTIRKFDL